MPNNSLEPTLLAGENAMIPYFLVNPTTQPGSSLTKSSEQPAPSRISSTLTGVGDSVLADGFRLTWRYRYRPTHGELLGEILTEAFSRHFYRGDSVNAHDSCIHLVEHESASTDICVIAHITARRRR